MCPATGFLCKWKLPVTPDQCSRFCFSGEKNPRKYFRFSEGLLPGTEERKDTPSSSLALTNPVVFHSHTFQIFQWWIFVSLIWVLHPPGSAPPLAPLCAGANRSYLFSFSWPLLTRFSLNSLLGCWLHGPITPVGIAHLCHFQRSPPLRLQHSSPLWEELPQLCSPSIAPLQIRAGLSITLVETNSRALGGHHGHLRLPSSLTLSVLRVN